MKKIIRSSIILSVCVAALLFCSCDTQKSPEKSILELADVIESHAPLDAGYYSASERYFDYYFKVDGESIKNDVTEWTVRCSNSPSSENEFGILKAAKGKAHTVERACNEYIESRKSAYLDAKAAYSSEEYEKYDSARVLVVGDTVIYIILSAKEGDAVAKALK